VDTSEGSTLFGGAIEKRSNDAERGIGYEVAKNVGGGFGQAPLSHKALKGQTEEGDGMDPRGVGEIKNRDCKNQWKAPGEWGKEIQKGKV